MTFLERKNRIKSIDQAHPIVQQQVALAVDLFCEIPEVKEARLFGSAQRLDWTPTRSIINEFKSKDRDIDVAVIIRGNPPEWSYFTEGPVCVGRGEDGESIIRNIIGGAPKRVSLDNIVTKRGDRIELHIATERDLVCIKREGLPLPRGLLANALDHGIPPKLFEVLYQWNKKRFPNAIKKGFLIFENKG